jgi:FtsK/SpoIIIE family
MLSRISDHPGVSPAARTPASVAVARRRALEVGLPVALGVYAAGTVLAAFGLPPLALGVGCLALGAVLVVTALVRGEPDLRTAHSAACGAVVAAWLAFAGTAAPWAWPPAVILALATVAAVWLYPRIIEREHRAQEEARRAALIARAQREQRKWPDLLARIGHPGVRFAGREDTQAGYVVHLQLPGSGKVTYSGLAPATEKLEVAARLRHGSLRFERGDQAHKVVLHVAERDVLGETIPFPVPDPDDTDVLSIVNPIPVGLFEDGQVCAVTLREMATLIVGLRGSGKSNLLNVLLAQLSRCADVLIFAIDLKGGRMAAPWIEPWLEGRSPRPVVDWLATDREEAERMLRALLRAVQARSRSGSGGEKIMPSARQPAILLVCDEIAVILGMGMGGPRSSAEGVTNLTLAGLATQLVMTGRSEAIDLIMATQRGSVTMTGSADLKSQCALRIGLGVSSEGDARLIIPDDVKIAADLARLRHPGTGIVQQGKQGRVLPVKFFRIEHDAISAIAERGSMIRPGPDPLLEEALGEDYARRWDFDRAQKIPGVFSRSMVPAAIAAPVPEPALELAPEPLVLAAPGPAELAEPVVQAAPAEPTAPAEQPEQGEQPEAEQAEQAEQPEAEQAEQPQAEPARRRMAAMLQAAGVRGMTIRAIAEQLAADGQDVAHQTIYRWLNEELVAGRAEDASYGRWKWRPKSAAGPELR